MGGGEVQAFIPARNFCMYRLCVCADLNTNIHVHALHVWISMSIPQIHIKLKWKKPLPQCRHHAWVETWASWSVQIAEENPQRIKEFTDKETSMLFISLVWHKAHIPMAETSVSVSNCICKTAWPKCPCVVAGAASGAEPATALFFHRLRYYSHIPSVGKAWGSL